MKNNSILLAALLMAMPLWAQEAEHFQQDSAVVDRTVYVEREFQPTVQQAGKIAVKPQVYEPQLVLQEPVYSHFDSPLSLDYNVRQLDFSTLNFRHPSPLNGFLRAGVGHPNSLFDFNYRVTDSQMQHKKKQSANDLILDLYAHHLGQWGKKALSESTLGFEFSKTFRNCEMYFGAQGGNDYFRRYAMASNPSQLVWTADTKIGVRSLPGNDIKYAVQTGYEAFVVPNFAIEHQIRTKGEFSWSKNYHTAGLAADIQNRFYSADDTVGAVANHRIHLEPYYEYEHSRFHVHAGVNLDFAAGRGRVAGVSPNLHLEVDLTKNWLATYLNVSGDYAANGARGEYLENRYRSMSCLFGDTISSEYRPVNMMFGFKIRPYETLFMDLHVGYALTIDKHVNIYEEATGYYEHELQKTGCLKVGADVHYHWRDIILLNAGANYLGNKAFTTIGGLEDDFDEPKWEAHLRLDVKFNQKWSIYSDNFLLGSRQACVYDGTTYRAEKLRPTFDLNIGLQYNVNRWLSVYAQLNNYLAWTDQLSWQTYYGYEAQRANCLFGLTWSF